MYEVVVGVDRDESRARACARAVAGLPGDPAETRVTVVHSFQDNPTGASAPQMAAVRAARERLEAAGVTVEVAESSGDPAEVILAVAEEVDADLVVVAARRRSPAGKALFGSTTQALVSRSPLPVLVPGRDDGWDEHEAGSGAGEDGR
jgi:nucleotide-binding universal stress UspA family protein